MSTPKARRGNADKNWHPEQKTIEIHGRTAGDEHWLRPTLHRVTAFRLGSFERGRKLFAGKASGFIYSRINNPTVDELEKKLAALEGAEACLATASGMAAIELLAKSLAHSGGHILASNRLYGGVFHLLRENLPKLGISVTLVENPLDIQSWEKAIRPNTKLIYVETPSNPVIDIFDVRELAAFAHSHKIPLAVDSTLATSALATPLKEGADIIVHSLSKYVGDGKVIAGALLGKQALMDDIRLTWFRDTGACLSPDNAMVLYENIETLSGRMQEHCQNALAVVEYLSRHPKVSRVLYPTVGPNAARNKILMPKGFGGLMAFEVHGGRKNAKIVLENLKLFWHAPNIGESRSLVIHPATTTHGQLTKPELESAGITQGILRLSIGREDPKDLIRDLEQALKKI